MSRAGIKVIQESSFFDEKEYAAKHPDVAMSGLGAAEHYFHIGGRLGRAPGPDFDAAGYLARYLDVAGRGDNPLIHFERHGSGEGRDPRPAPASPVQQKDTDGKTRIDIIVPVYNALEDVKACLNSLKACETSFALRAIVINDGSDKATSSWLQEFCAAPLDGYARFELIDHQGNRGYTKAVNTGLRASDAPYLVTLNSDTIVTPFWADGLVRCLESDPQLGIVGPLSNAASWQNVPALMAPEGGFAINALPDGISPADMAGIVRQASRRAYPRSPFVNGFCFMLRREVLDAVGYMDEAAFPTGYGEENDFCIRAQDAGFTLAFADDTYVFHAKSKSFGTARREELSKAGDAALRSKHGDVKFSALLKKIPREDIMYPVRARIQRSLASTMARGSIQAVDWVRQQKVLFIMPVCGAGGGTHSVVQEVTAMRAMGVDAKVAVYSHDYKAFLQIYSEIENVEDVFVRFNRNSLVAVAQVFDVAVATLYSSVTLLQEIIEAHPGIMPAYYAQDYEPLFFDPGSERHEEAMSSYTRIGNCVIFAKTDWICQQIETHHGVRAHKVEASIDHAVYNPWSRPASAQGTTRVSAMIRPGTARRGAHRTMELLKRLKEAFGEALEVKLFGCDPQADDFLNLPGDFAFTHFGVLTRPEVAQVLQGSDIFIDLSDYQAFGRTSLEAMACGTMAVVPEKGGSYEYAIDGVNALIVDTMDVEACLQRILPLLNDPEKMEAMRMEGLQTAARYSPRRAALSELTLFARELSKHQKETVPGLRRRVHLIPGVTSPGEDGIRNVTGSGYVRLCYPYGALSTTGDWSVSINYEGELPPPGAADIAIIQRDLTGDGQKRFQTWQKEWRAAGGRIIYEIDDDLLDSPALNERGFAGDTKALAVRIHEYCAAADTITVSTSHLAEVLDPYRDKVITVPNYIDASLWKLDQAQTAPDRAAPDGKLVVGYFGTPTHNDDLMVVTDAIKALEKKHDIEVEVVGAFQLCEPFFGTRIPLPRQSIYPSFVNWLRQIARWDIAIIPLLDSSFNRSKSNLKFLECAALNTAIICSDGVEYRKVARNDENCLMVHNDTANWLSGLERLIEDHALRTRLAQAAYQDARDKWTVQRNIGLYEEVLFKTLAAN